MKNKTLKKSLCAFLAVLMIFGIFGVSATASDLPFTDVGAGQWYRPYVQAVRDQGIMQGTSATHFSPDETFSRGQIVATVFRIHTGRRANESDSRSNHFSDVSATEWYAPYVTWANANNISQGATTTRFGPNDSVSRWEIALIMHNYIRNLSDLDSSSTATAQWNAFTDVWQIGSPSAYYALRWANNNGIINGRETTILAPDGTAIRAEAAAMLVRLVNFIDNGMPQPPTDPSTWNADQWRTYLLRYESLTTLPNRQLTTAERQTWIAEYHANGGANLFELEVVRLTNEIRVSYGLNPVAIHNTFMYAARFYTQTMANLNATLAHNVGPYGGSFGTAGAFVATVGCGFFASNANGHWGQWTPQGTVDGWMNSPGHRANILAPHVTHIGVGNYRGGQWGIFHYMLLGR